MPEQQHAVSVASNSSSSSSSSVWTLSPSLHFTAQCLPQSVMYGRTHELAIVTGVFLAALSGGVNHTPVNGFLADFDWEGV